MDNEQYKSVLEITKLVGIPKPTLYTWIKENKIQVIKRNNKLMIDMHSLSIYLDKCLRKRHVSAQRLEASMSSIKEDCLNQSESDQWLESIPSEELTAEEQMDRQDLLELLNKSLDQIAGNDCCYDTFWHFDKCVVKCRFRMYSVICMRHGLRGHKQMSFREICQKIGRSYNRAHQLYDEGLILLKEIMLRNL